MHVAKRLAQRALFGGFMSHFQVPDKCHWFSVSRVFLIGLDVECSLFLMGEIYFESFHNLRSLEEH